MASVFGLFKVPFGMRIPKTWFDGIVDAIDFLYYGYLQHQQELDCIEGKLDLLIYYAYQEDTYLKLIKQELENIEKKLDTQNHYLRFISAGKGIKTIIKTVTTSPTPLFLDELEVKRIIIKVPTTALYVVYIGDSESQDFPLFAGEKEELEVKDPSKIYVRAEGEEKIFALFELAQ